LHKYPGSYGMVRKKCNARPGIYGDFTIIYDDEVDLILELCKSNNINKYNMIHLYLYILSFIKENDKDEDYKLAYPSINNISEALG
jgi:hypothetical protein